MKRAGRYKKDVVCFDHPVARINGCPFDDWQNVALHAFA